MGAGTLLLRAAPSLSSPQVEARRGVHSWECTPGRSECGTPPGLPAPGEAAPPGAGPADRSVPLARPPGAWCTSSAPPPSSTPRSASSRSTSSSTCAATRCATAACGRTAATSPTASSSSKSGCCSSTQVGAARRRGRGTSVRSGAVTEEPVPPAHHQGSALRADAGFLPLRAPPGLQAEAAEPGSCSLGSPLAISRSHPLAEPPFACL